MNFCSEFISQQSKTSIYMNRSDTQETPSPEIKDMVPFEKHLWNRVNKLKFRKIKTNFQRKLNEDIREIKRSNKVLVFADKMSNIYKLDTDEYKKLTAEVITSTKSFLIKNKRQN